MIFLTVGTHVPFDRLVKAVDDWCEASGCTEVFGQITDRKGTGYIPQHFEWVARLDPEQYKAKFAGSRFVISHAGMGSIITALSMLKPIVVLPRRAHLGEHRNDHQYATVKSLGSRPGIFVSGAEHELPAMLNRISAVTTSAADKQPLSPYADERLTTTLRKFIQG